MATSKKAAPKTTLAGIQAFPAKVSVASTKLADKVLPAKKPTRAKKATAARPPAVLAKSGKLLGADPKGVPGVKATEKVQRDSKRIVADTGTSFPVYGVTSVAELAKVLGDFPRGSSFLVGGSNIDIYNLRGKMVATIRQVAKPAKGAKK